MKWNFELFPGCDRLSRLTSKRPTKPKTLWETGVAFPKTGRKQKRPKRRFGDQKASVGLDLLKVVGNTKNILPNGGLMVMNPMGSNTKTNARLERPVSLLFRKVWGPRQCSDGNAAVWGCDLQTGLPLFSVSVFFFIVPTKQGVGISTLKMFQLFLCLFRFSVLVWSDLFVSTVALWFLCFFFVGQK